MLKIGKALYRNSVKPKHKNNRTVHKPWENPFDTPQKRENAYERGVRKVNPGAIKCGDMEIPICRILCMREVPNCFPYPKTVVTALENNPQADNMPLVTEYEYPGSLAEWCKAYEEAGDTWDTVTLDIKG